MLPNLAGVLYHFRAMSPLPTIPNTVASDARHHLLDARRIQRAIDKREAELEQLRQDRREAWLRANRAGVAYPVIEELLDVSDGLLCREIARARREAKDPDLKSRAPRSRPKRPGRA